MNTIPFTKVEAIGNSFVLVNALMLPDMNWPMITRRMCDHHFGIGSDGLLVVGASKTANFEMRMFNPDGSEDICGNGLRCAAAHVYFNGLAPSKKMLFEMKDGVHQVEIVEAEAGVACVKAGMGRPSFSAKDIPTTISSDNVINYPIKVGGHTHNLTCVLVGSPHAVIFAPLEDFWDEIPKQSAIIEKHPAFPELISVDWCAVESRNLLKIRTWERAVGPTLGCGTGACASLLAANVCGLADTHASVVSPGGTLDVEWPDRGDVFLSGPTHMVFDGEWPLIGDEKISQDVVS